MYNNIEESTLKKSSLRRTSNSFKPDEKMLKRLDKFNEIIPGLYMSSVNGCSNEDNIKSNNISHILMMGSEFNPLFKDTVKYYYVAIKDEPTENIKQYLDNIVEFIDRSIESGGQVALHCRRSVSRTASAAIAYLIWKEGMSYDYARDYVRSKRVDINPNAGFTEQVKEWAKENKGKGSVTCASKSGVY